MIRQWLATLILGLVFLAFGCGDEESTSATEPDAATDLVGDLGEVDLQEPSDIRQATIDKAMSSYGMWSDRDPDDFLRQSRAGLDGRDRGLEDARVDV